MPKTALRKTRARSDVDKASMLENAGAFDPVLTWHQTRRHSDPLTPSLENIPECSPEEEELLGREERSVRGSWGEGAPGDASGEGAFEGSGSDDAQIKEIEAIAGRLAAQGPELQEAQLHFARILLLGPSYPQQGAHAGNSLRSGAGAGNSLLSGALERFLVVRPTSGLDKPASGLEIPAGGEKRKGEQKEKKEKVFSKK
ncbi:hypothetical protein T484DRAFT_1834727 [Baffinella frigidus]|nr:hypothetical protein T484DRAFT_1834727 [Cryptophyta sp. CCMP2293]